MKLLCAVLGSVLLATLGASAQAQILIGQTSGFSGSSAAGAKETTAGAQLYLEAINAKGGVHGQKIELRSLDDQSDPQLAVKNAKTLIEEQHVLALFLTRGTPQNEAILPLLEQHGVPLIAPSTGAMVLHRPVRKQVFNVRSPYQREAEKAVAHLARMGILRIAVLYSNDSFGKDGLVGLQKGLVNAKLVATVEAPLEQASANLSGLVQKITATDTQAVMLIATAATAVGGIKALKAAGSKAQLVTLSNNASGGFVASLGDSARGVIVTQVFPQSSGFLLVKEATELARAKGISDTSPAMLEGFAAAKVLVEALRRAGPQPNREKIQSALEGLQKFDIGGLDISYSPTDHTGLDFTDLSIISHDGKFRR